MDLTQTHRSILEVLAESDLKLPPGVIAENTGNSGAYVRQLCKELLEKELIKDVATGQKPFYKITEKGRQSIRRD